MTKTLCTLFALWLFLNAVDVALTIANIRAGTGAEGNFYLTRLPLAWSMVLKLSGALLVGALLVKWHKTGMVVAASVAMVGVCAWNGLTLIGG